MTTLGKELKQERERKGITLQEIADATKINMRFLRALEDDRMDILPGKFFIRGIIRSYVNYIGLPEKTILDTYFDAGEIDEGTVKEEPKKPAAFEQQTTVFRKLFKITILTIFILAIVIPLYFILRHNKPEPTPPPQLLQNEVIEKSNPDRRHEILPVKEPEDLNMRIRFSAETWIQIYADGKLVLNGLMQPGQESEVKALIRFSINLGNAGGMTYLLNDEPGKPLGIAGQVVKDIRITIDNYRTFLYSDKEIPEEKRDK